MRINTYNNIFILELKLISYNSLNTRRHLGNWDHLDLPGHNNKPCRNFSFLSDPIIIVIEKFLIELYSF